jgi:class 3 adenylate cyclase/pimeloyl-ACP methyl ester carboxylesterase
VRLTQKEARLGRVKDSEVRWAELEGKSIAYEVFGTGPIDLLFGQRWCPIDLMWDLPQLALFLSRLGSMARVITFDTLGSGASDRVVDRVAAPIELYADASLAVLDAAESARAVLFDATGGMSSATFAAMYPQRVQSLILVNFRSSYPEMRGLTRAQLVGFGRLLHGVRSLEVGNPRVAHDPSLRQWWERALRLRYTREDSVAQAEWGAGLDIESILPTIRVPTLVLHRRDNRLFDVERSRAAAAQIPNGQFVELPGSESDIFLGDTDPVFMELDRFLSAPETPIVHDRPLATVLFTDMVSSTEQLAARGDDAWRRLLDDHDATMNDIVSDYRGQLVKPTGDGILATFDGVARAVRCAAALLDGANRQGIALRAGLHAGEIEVRPTDIAGIAVHIANRISTLAGPNEILVSRTVVDLTAGSGLQFEARGEHKLKGVPGTWSIFRTCPTTPGAAP